MNIHQGAAEDFNNFLLFHKIELQADERKKIKLLQKAANYKAKGR